MFSPDDTIVAIATPPGRGGIGVVRISGPQAVAIGLALTGRRTLEPRYATLSRLRAAGAASGDPHGGRPRASGEGVDEALVTAFPAPHSFTGQDVVEISAHGSPVVLQSIVRSVMAAGARLAQPGEFTLRSFLNGKRDLVQAEAVGDLVAAVTPLQARVAFDQLEGTLTRRVSEVDSLLFDLIARLEASLDFPDEGYHFIEPADVAGAIDGVIAQLDDLLGDASRGRMIREGATVVIAGRPNVGKSSLFNALAGSERAIVTPVPGTTRDLVTEQIDIEGLAVTLVDTAGTRETLDVVEREGVSRAERARAVADLVIAVSDASAPVTSEDEIAREETRGARRLRVANKSDLVPSAPDAWSSPPGPLRVSAVSGHGLAELRRAIVRELAGGDAWRDTTAVTNIRHVQLLQAARTDLEHAREAAGAEALPEEFVLADLQAAKTRFDEMVGRRTTDDLLRHIFERFCIGK